MLAVECSFSKYSGNLYFISMETGKYLIENGIIIIIGIITIIIVAGFKSQTLTL